MLNSAIIKPALRALGVIGAGREPTQAQKTEALEALEGVISSLASGLLGGPWIEQDVSADVLAEENDSIRVNATEDVTITLPVTTQFRERSVDVCGCITIEQRCTGARAPLDGSKVRISDVLGTITPRLYLYRADAGTWYLANSLTYEGDCPLGEAHRQGLIGMLAEALADSYGVNLPPNTAKQAAMGRLALAQRLDRPRQPLKVQYF